MSDMLFDKLYHVQICQKHMNIEEDAYPSGVSCSFNFHNDDCFGLALWLILETKVDICEGNKIRNKTE